jgi:general secretion pathway protein H
VRPTFAARRNRARDPKDSRSGFVLLDIVLALAVTALLAAIAWATVPRGTSAARHAGYAMEIAAMLKNDRSAAARQMHEVATRVDVGKRLIASGSGRRVIALPRDLALDVLTSDICAAGAGQFKIAFSADGRACGTVLRLAKGERDWKVRVNWLTGHIDVVPPGRA